MRVGIDATAIPKNVAGAGRYILGLINGLSKIDCNIEFYIYCREVDSAKFRELPENFHLRVLQNLSKHRRIYWQLIGLQKWIQQDKIDLWHSTHYITPIVRLNCPIVVTIHDLAFFHFPQFYSRQKGYFFRWAIENACKRAKALITVSKSTQEDLKKRFPLASPSFVVYSGIEEAFCKEDDSDFKPTKPYILTVGTQEKRKNFPFLVKVFGELVKKFPNLDLVFIGKEENDTINIKNMIASLDLTEKVHLRGYVNEVQLWNYYRNADLFCMPSQYEGFGFPVLEAMAVKTPVLISNRPAMTELGREFVLSAECMNLDDWVNIARSALLAPPSLAHLNEAAAFARTFSWEATAKQMVSIYGQFMAQPPNSQDIKNGHTNSTLPDSKPAPSLENAILKTMAFSDVFKYPLTQKEIHADLVQQKTTIDEVKTALALLCENQKIEREGHHYFFPGRNQLIASREQRNNETVQLLTKHKKMLNFICQFPGVKAVALSGAASYGNCTLHDDIDLFIITDHKRLWFVYSILVLLFKVTGKRSIFCLNYMISENCEEGLPENFFVAHQISHLRPLTNANAIYEYQANHDWVHEFLPQGGSDSPIDIQQFPQKMYLVKRLLRLSIFNIVEALFYKLSSSYTRRITRSFGTDSVILSREKIKLFTNNHLKTIMLSFTQRLRTVNFEPTKKAHKSSHFETFYK